MTTKEIYGFEIGDTLYVADLKKNKVYKFVTDVVKVFKNNITAHGIIYGMYGDYGIPTEYSIKHLNKRCIFTTRKDANEWLKEH